MVDHVALVLCLEAKVCIVVRLYPVALLGLFLVYLVRSCHGIILWLLSFKMFALRCHFVLLMCVVSSFLVGALQPFLVVGAESDERSGRNGALVILAVITVLSLPI